MLVDGLTDGGVYYALDYCDGAGVHGVNWLTDWRHQQQQEGEADGRRAGGGGAEPEHADGAAAAAGTAGGGRTADAGLLHRPAVTAVGL